MSPDQPDPPPADPKAKPKLPVKTGASVAGAIGLVEIADLVAQDVYHESLSYPLAWKAFIAVLLRGSIFAVQHPDAVRDAAARLAAALRRRMKGRP